LQVVPFRRQDSERWDRLVENAPMATFLHTRRFLAYHGDRFEDASLLVNDDRSALRAVLPAALDPADAGRVVSHPGATYGGLVHDGTLYADGVRDALSAACAHYAESGLRSFRYKPVPHIYHLSPSEDDVWALSDLGARRARCDLSCAIDLAARRPPSERRRRSLRKASRSGIQVTDDPALMSAFWPVLEATLDRRYATAPVHSLEEIQLLRERFPETIRVVAGLDQDELVAGIVLFATPRVFLIHDMATTENGMRVGATDAVAERCIDLAAEEGVRYFDFGTSMEDRGPRLQIGLHRFKAEFGGGGVVVESYEQELGSPAGYQLSSSA